MSYRLIYYGWRLARVGDVGSSGSLIAYIGPTKLLDITSKFG